ncbi:MAG: DUF4331 family protein [Saprospiraceae bacterium]|nr:DUF4331 family protein [Saprospiraceae bacterium]
MKNFNIKNILLTMVLMTITAITTFASSHREAPLISNDPLADNVDVYAFRSPDNPNTVTLIATYIPFQLPHGGPNYYTFGENIRYEIHVDNDASVVGDEVTYRFTFNLENEDPTTFFNIRLGKQNQKATYTLERSLDGGVTFETIISNGIVPPNNIGERSIGGGAGLGGDYAEIWGNAITTASTGETVFAGPTDDPFFVDLGGIFDLGDASRQNGNPRDGVACYNVSTLAIQVPISTLLKSGASSTPSDILDPDYVIGVWASASRPSMTTLSSDANPSYSGDWVQVSRLGMPLTNEAVIPIGYKDFWNSITPYDELAETEMDEFFYNPELALYMDDDLFGGAVPAFSALRIQEASLGAFDFTNGADGVSALKGGDLTGTAFETFGDLLLIPGKPRSVDLWPIFHTGVPNAIPYQLATGKGGNPVAAGKPFINNFLPNGGDMLRLNMAVPPTPRDDANYSSLGLVQAAAIGLTVAPFNTTADLEFIPNMDGFPNGRRLEDDVTRIELQAVSGVVLAAIGLWYDDYDPNTSASPVTDDLLGVLTYTTGVEANDKPFRNSFPYVAMPFSGTGDCSGEIYEGTPESPDSESSLFISSNTTGQLGVLNTDNTRDIKLNLIDVAAMDADGVHYDSQNDVIYQLNRSNNVINAYDKVLASVNSGTSASLTATSSSDFINGREIAVRADKLVVAQDANDANGMTNKFVVYDISPNRITYSTEYSSPINLWGIQFVGSSLFAIEDNSENLVVFENFLSNTGSDAIPSKTISIENMVRTHGLTIDNNGLMILTDVGEASSADDGAVIIVKDFESAISDDMISESEQIRIEGNSTLLGNPVDVAFDNLTETIYVAERANGGGRILGFPLNSMNGDANPSYSRLFAGASAVFYSDYNEEEVVLNNLAQFYTSSNTSNEIGVYQVREDRSIGRVNLEGQAMDSDGIHYDFTNDLLYELDRTNNVVNIYGSVKDSIDNGSSLRYIGSSTSDFINGREIAVIDDRLVVAQDANDANGMMNMLFVYRLNGEQIMLEKSFTTQFNLWGIHAEEDALYAIMDNTNRLAIMNNFYGQPEGLITPDVEVTVEGLVRTHGLTYDKSSDMMILTDIGEASSDSDGGIVKISAFSSKIDDGMISFAEQVRIGGDATELGNPVDVAIDENTKMIYVAERAKEGGKVLGFSSDASDNARPVFDRLQAGVSAIFFDNMKTGTVNVEDVNLEVSSLTVYPNPASDRLYVELDELFEANEALNMTLTDVSGRLIMQNRLRKSLSSIDVSTLETGVYLLTIGNSKSSQTIRFSKID